MPASWQCRADPTRAAYFGGSDCSRPPTTAYWRAQPSDYTVALWVKARWGTILEAKGINQPLALWTDRINRGYAGQPQRQRPSTTTASPSRVRPCRRPSEWAHVVRGL